VSYLEKLVWLLTGNLGKPGAQYAPATFVPIVRASRNELDPATAPRSPVVNPDRVDPVQRHPRRDPDRSSQAIPSAIR
jgi:hypothetical protein